MTFRSLGISAAGLAFLCVAALPSCGNAGGNAKADKNAAPNVVVIFTDDMGYADPSSYGGTWVKTPHIDELAQDWVLFTDGYTVAPVCGPSRVGLLTGAYPARFGVFWNEDTLRTKLPDSQTLLPNMVRSAGYKSAVIGKWNLTSDASANADVVKDEMIWGASYWPDDKNIYTGVGGGFGAAETPSGKWGPEKPGDEYLTDRLSQHAVNFIDESGDNPFFLYLAYNSPHSPLEAHKRHKDAVSHLEDPAEQVYAAMLLSIDDGVGYVMNALKAKGLEDNTLVIFMSDNGPAGAGFRGWPDDWAQRNHIGQKGPLNGKKGTLYEGGIRVPFIAKWPNKIAANQTVTAPVITLDVYKTVADIAGVTLNNAVISDGVNLLDVINREDAMQDRALYWAGRKCGKKQPEKCVDFGAVRKGDYKLLTAQKEKPQLFNLTNDISESADLKSKERARYKELSALYGEWHAQLPKKSSTQISRKSINGKPDKETPLTPVLTDKKWDK